MRPPGDHPKSAHTYPLTLLLLVSFSGAVVLSLLAERAVGRANEDRLAAYLLVDELRQSSDDLTTMIRTYVATGKPEHKERHQEILDIREGRKPRPPGGAAWDLAQDGSRRPPGPALPLVELMRRAGFPPVEVAKVDEAKAAADTLMRTEHAAMALIETPPVSEAQRAWALRMLDDGIYHRAKGEIMDSISDLRSMVAERTLQAVRGAERHASRMRLLVILAGLLLLFVLVRPLFEGTILGRAPISPESRILDDLDAGSMADQATDQAARGPARIAENGSVRTNGLEAKRIPQGQDVAALDERDRRFRFIVENAVDVIWMMDVASGSFTYVSPSAHQLLGFRPEEVVGRPVADSLTPESAEHMRAVVDEFLLAWKAGDQTDTPRVFEVDQPHRDGRLIHGEVIATLHGDERGDPTVVLGVTRDVTQRKAVEETVRQQALYDSLTRLPNRRLLLDRLRLALSRARREDFRVALLFVDLDRFKPVNDELGHQVGDWLLQSVSERLLLCLRGADTAARIGGDEFVILLPDIFDGADALTIAERIRQALAQPFVTAEGRSLELSSSIGVALYPDHAEEERELLRLGDLAMYAAKSAGRDRVALASGASGPEGRAVHSRTAAFLRLSWKPSYASGDATIDAEHRELFRLTNRIIDVALDPGAEAASVEMAFDVFLAHVRGHFEHEEALLRQVGFAQADGHSRLHSALLARASALRREVAGGRATVGDLVDFLAVELVAHHILQADRSYFPILSRARGSQS